MQLLNFAEMCQGLSCFADTQRKDGTYGVTRLNALLNFLARNNALLTTSGVHTIPSGLVMRIIAERGSDLALYVGLNYSRTCVLLALAGF